MGERLSAELELRTACDHTVYVAIFQVSIVKHLPINQNIYRKMCSDRYHLKALLFLILQQHKLLIIFILQNAIRS